MHGGATDGLLGAYGLGDRCCVAILSGHMHRNESYATRERLIHAQWQIDGDWLVGKSRHRPAVHRRLNVHVVWLCRLTVAPCNHTPRTHTWPPLHLHLFGVSLVSGFDGVKSSLSFGCKHCSVCVCARTHIPARVCARQCRQRRRRVCRALRA
jgi:hypothetical protein